MKSIARDTNSNLGWVENVMSSSQAAGLSKALMTNVSKSRMNALETHYRALPIRNL